MQMALRRKDPRTSFEIRKKNTETGFAIVSFLHTSRLTERIPNILLLLLLYEKRCVPV